MVGVALTCVGMLVGDDFMRLKVLRPHRDLLGLKFC